MVMNHAPDLKALLNMAAAFPDVISKLERRGDNFVPLFMSRFSPAELHRLANTFSALHSKVSVNDLELDLMNAAEFTFLLFSSIGAMMLYIDSNISQLSRVLTFFFFACAFLALKSHPPPQQDEPGDGCWPVTDSKMSYSSRILEVEILLTHLQIIHSEYLE